MGDQDLVAVATGDVRNSTEYSSPDRRELPEILHHSFEEVAEFYSLTETPRFNLSRGDSWQFYLPRWELSLEILLSFLARLAGREPSIRSRASVAVDTIEFLSDRNVGESDGNAFRRSGRGLEDLPEGRNFLCRLPGELDEVFHICAESVGETVDMALEDWTVKQARAVGGMLEIERRRALGEDATQKSIAESWRPDAVTPQTVQKHLKRGHWYRIKRELERFQRLSFEIQKWWES